MNNPGDNLSRLPPLASLATVAAACSLCINRLLVPALGKYKENEFLFDLIRYGQFATNLTGVAGLVALSAAIVEFVRHPEYASFRRRLGIACFAGGFLPTIALATFLPQERTTIHVVMLGIGAANVLTVIIAMNAARFVGPASARIALVAIAATALFALSSQVYYLISSRQLDAFHIKIVVMLRSIGEFCYVVFLLVATLVVTPRGTSLRDQFARIAAVIIFGASITGLRFAHTALGGDFALLLYHAQRVSYLIDKFPFAYAFPICISFAAAIGGILGKDRARGQAGVGIVLLLCAGYAPYAPERLLIQTLAAFLVARSVIALAITAQQKSAISTT